MTKLIEKLRNKPESVKKRIVLITAIGLTAIVVIFWVFTWQYNFKSDKKNKGPGLFNQMKDNFSNMFSEISVGLGNVTSKFKEVKESEVNKLQNNNEVQNQNSN
ncbi:MAG: hypothetical protein WDK96_02510 [Candidatus Paceibacterota bacterium]|jgi:predicted permease